MDERIALYKRALVATREYAQSGGLNGGMKKGWR